MKTNRIQNKNFRQSDFIIIVLTTILVFFGLVMVFSASYYKSINDSGTPYAFLIRQSIYAVMGFFLMAFCTFVDYHFYKKIAKLVLAVSLLLLLVLFTPLGVNAGGATRLFYIGPISVMPGEVAKIGVIIFAAAYLSVSPKRILSFKQGILPMVALMVIFGGIIMKLPNLSTALTVVGIIAGIMFLAGLQWRWIILAMSLGSAGIGSIIAFGDKLGGAHWKKRFVSFLDPFADELGDGYQVVQSLLALGSGGLFGKGLGNSIQKNLYLPEPQNDFILAIIGEEIGFIGLLLLLTVYVLLIWRCFHVCLNAKDSFGMLLTGGITVMLGLQVILNVAVVTSSMPATGIALPFISYGGNSLWIFMGAMGMVLNVSRQSVTSVSEVKK